MEWLLAAGVSPWDAAVLEGVAGTGGGLGAVRAWLGAVLRSHPTCLVLLPCLALLEER